MTTPGGSDEQGWGRQDPGQSPYGGNPYGQQQPYGGQQPQGQQSYGGGQQPYGYGEPPPYGQQQPYGGQAPYGGQPPYGQQQAYGYGGMTPMPGGTPPPIVPRPSEVGTAFWLWIANIVVGIVSVAVTFLTLDSTVTAQVRDQLATDPQLSTVNAESFVRIALVVGAVFTLLFAGLKLFFLFKMRSGRNWARVTLTVFGGLSILLTVVSLGQASGIEAGFGLVGAILIVAAIVFMFTGGARDYFASRPKY